MRATFITLAIEDDALLLRPGSVTLRQAQARVSISTRSCSAVFYEDVLGFAPVRIDEFRAGKVTYR